MIATGVPAHRPPLVSYPLPHRARILRYVLSFFASFLRVHFLSVVAVRRLCFTKACAVGHTSPVHCGDGLRFPDFGVGDHVSGACYWGRSPGEISYKKYVTFTIDTVGGCIVKAVQTSIMHYGKSMSWLLVRGDVACFRVASKVTTHVHGMAE